MSLILGIRVNSSIIAAPLINSETSRLIRAKGSRPTELVILVLPPTQSGRLNIFNQFSNCAFLYNWLSFIVIAIAFEFQSKFLFSTCFLIIFIAIFGSGVPPDLLTTTNNVVANLSDNSSNFSLIKNGSILSMYEKFNPQEFSCNASVINNGPKPLPPIPIHKTLVNF